MEFHQLRYFVAAAETSSMSRAAERERKRIQLTEAGACFLTKARQLLCDAESGVPQVREQFGDERRTLRPGFISPFLDDLVAPAVREFQQRHAMSKVSLFDLPPSAQIDRLRQHELDATILGNLADHERLHVTVKRLSRHRFAAVLPEDHDLAGRKSIKLAALKNDGWVSLSDTFFPGRRESLTAHCRNAGFVPRIVAELDSIPLMLAAVATANGVGLISGHAAKLPHTGCVFVPLAAPAITSELLLVLPKSSPTPEMADLIALLGERAA